MNIRRQYAAYLALPCLFWSIPLNVLFSNASVSFGVDVSYPVQHSTVLAGPLGDKEKFYSDLLNGCRDRFSSDCDFSEEDRISLNFEQPKNVVNLTDIGYKKIRAPDHAFELLRDFWEKNKDELQELEDWPPGDMTCNHWESQTYMVNLEAERLRGAGHEIKRMVWNAAEEVVKEWVGQDLRACSMYGIRVYTEGSVLSPHVDRFPLVSSAVVNVAQDVDEPWPLEVYGRDGMAVNITMEPGDMVLYESHSLIHGRPFPLKGRYMANVFIHFEPKALAENGLPVYLIPDAPKDIVDTWKTMVAENKGEGLEERKGWSDEKEESEDDGSTGAHFAAASGDIDTLEEIASNNADELYSMDSNGWKPLHEAARGGHKDAVALLVEYGADINERTDNSLRETPLQLAISEHGKDHPIVNFLESLGAIDFGPEF